MKMDSPKVRAGKILPLLQKTYPHARCELNYKSALELLIATILSAQCTDARVNEVTPALFSKYRTAKDFAKASSAELEAAVRSTGFYRNKARSIQNCCTQLTMEHGGKVPEDMEKLIGLSGVGRKTANLVRAYAFGLPGIICDTHVLRVSERLGLTKQKDPDKVEADLAAIVPEGNWTEFSTLIMTHGRRCCAARSPSCPTCPVLKLCPRYGLT
ncbi:MAG: endonuclease III [Pseudomonadota bacterium]